MHWREIEGEGADGRNTQKLDVAVEYVIYVKTDRESSLKDSRSIFTSVLQQKSKIDYSKRGIVITSPPFIADSCAQIPVPVQ